MSKHDSIFITEDDKFTVTIKYYMDGREPVIEGLSDPYDPKDNEESFEVYFKYPSQGDCEKIASVKRIENFDKASEMDILEFEIARLAVLQRGWSLEKNLEKELVNIHPLFINSLRMKIREEIGVTGITY